MDLTVDKKWLNKIMEDITLPIDAETAGERLDAIDGGAYSDDYYESFDKALQEEETTDEPKWYVQYYDETDPRNGIIVGWDAFYDAVDAAENDMEIHNIFPEPIEAGLPCWTEEEGLIEEDLDTKPKTGETEPKTAETVEEAVKIMEEAEDMVECAECFELSEKAKCKQREDGRYVCETCCVAGLLDEADTSLKDKIAAHLDTWGADDKSDDELVHGDPQRVAVFVDVSGSCAGRLENLLKKTGYEPERFFFFGNNKDVNDRLTGFITKQVARNILSGNPSSNIEIYYFSTFAFPDFADAVKYGTGGGEKDIYAFAQANPDVQVIVLTPDDDIRFSTEGKAILNGELPNVTVKDFSVLETITEDMAQPQQGQPQNGSNSNQPQNQQGQAEAHPGQPENGSNSNQPQNNNQANNQPQNNQPQNNNQQQNQNNQQNTQVKEAYEAEAEKYAVPGFNVEVLDSFEEDGKKAYNVLYSAEDYGDLCEVELWEDPSEKVWITRNIYKPGFLNRSYNNFDEFKNDLQYNFDLISADKNIPEAVEGPFDVEFPDPEDIKVED